MCISYCASRHVSEELKDDTSSSEDELQNSSHRHREDPVKDPKHINREIRGGEFCYDSETSLIHIYTLYV